jgi:hypothetical protein
LIPAAKHQAIEDLGQGRGRLVTGGEHSYYLRNGIWRGADYSNVDQNAGNVGDLATTHLFVKGEHALAVKQGASKTTIRIYPTWDEWGKYVQMSIPLYMDVEKSPGQVRIYRQAAQALHELLFSDGGLKTQMSISNVSAETKTVYKFGLKLSGLQRVGRKIYDGETLLFSLPTPWIAEVDNELDSRRDVEESIDGDIVTIDLGDLTPFYGKNVIVDPSLPIASSTMDSMLFSGGPDTNYGGSTLIVPATNVPIQRYAIAYDFSALPPGVNVDSSSVEIYQYGKNYDPTGHFLTLARLTKIDWLEMQVTWNSASSGNAWTNPGGDFTETNKSSILMDGSVGLWREWNDADTIAQTEYGIINNGSWLHVLLKFENDTSPPLVNARFYSKDYSTPSLRPKMTIEYSEAAGGGGSPLLQASNLGNDLFNGGVN